MLKKHMSEDNQFLGRLLKDSQFRLFLTSVLSGGWNLVYALYHLVLAYVYHSWWFLTMGVYYLTACGMRASALRLSDASADEKSERRALRRNSALTFVLALIFSGVIFLSIAEKRNTVRSSVVAISIAAYTFYLAIMAVINLVRLQKNRTVQKTLLRTCSMLYVFGSLFSLERMMLVTFGDPSNAFIITMEAYSGAGIFIIILLFGVHLLRLASKKQLPKWTQDSKE